MSTRNKNRKKKSYEKFEIKFDGVRIFSKRMLILLVVVPTIIASIVGVKNVSYKADILVLQAKIKKQEKEINIQDSKINKLNKKLSENHSELESLKQQVEDYIVLSSDLVSEKQRMQNTILEDISAIQTSIYVMNNQIKLIRKHFQSKKKAPENK